MAEPIVTRSSVLQRAQRGQWNDFVQIYAPLIKAYAYSFRLAHVEADEVVNATFAVLMPVLKSGRFQYDREKGKFRSWLFTVTRREAAKLARGSAANATPATGDVAELAVDASPGPDELFEKLWLRSHVLRALELARAKVLPSTYQLFHCFCFDQMSAKAVAAKFQRSPQDVYNAKFSVLNQLKAELKFLD